MRLRILLPVALVLSLLAGTLAAPAQVDRSAIEEVLEQVKGIRGLNADSGVPVDYLSQDQLRERMIQDFEEENPEEEIRTASEIMVMLGFIDPELDLYGLYIDLYTEQIAGFYDAEENRMFLISEEQRMGPMDRYILAHELTHYLQDSNFDLQRPPFYDPPEAEEETDDDAAFAATCLVEGDAMLTSRLWLTRYMDPSDLLEMQRESGEFSTEVLDSAPEYIRDGLLFPYQEGEKFVEYLHRRGGFGNVDEAFRRPPKSTEQIYHPEKYLSGEDPVPLELADLSGELGEGWELAYDNVLGEFDVFELFKPYMRRDDAEEAAAGWGGNIYHYYRDAKGEKVLIQLYAWDGEDDASEFVAAYSNYLKKRFASGLREEEEKGAWRSWSGGDYFHALKKEGRNVYVLQATTEGALESVISGLGEGGEELGEELLGGDKDGGEEKIRDFGWLIVAGVAGLFFLGIVLIIVMFIVLRRPSGTPAPPGIHYPRAYGPGPLAPPRAGAVDQAGAPTEPPYHAPSPHEPTEQPPPQPPGDG
ncbi:MAG: hypothetical protein H5T72_04460 [Actinobacteria bacterium]|nr:hypothetical protein [Actinomycetota bacterium]